MVSCSVCEWFIFILSFSELIFLRIFDTADANTVNNEVLSTITNYLINVRRRDKIPKSDLIALLENIKGVDSVNISFISEENEKIKNDTEEENKQINPIKKIKKRKQSSIKKVFNTKLEPNTKSSANLATQLNKFMSSSYDTSDDETDIDVEKKTFDVILNSDSDLSSTEY